MMGLRDQGSECEEMSTQTPISVRFSSDSTTVKTCVDCGTSKTPLWRGGPAGPKSLCNACGIRSRKKRRALMGTAKEEKKAKKSPVQKRFSGESSSCTGSCADSKSKRLLAFGLDVVFQRPRSSSTHRRNLGEEEEQAAFLLMALSCGSVYA